MRHFDRRSILASPFSFLLIALVVVSGSGCTVPLYKESFLTAASDGPKWSPVRTGHKLGVGDHIHVIALAVDPKTPDTVYAATEILLTEGYKRDLIKTTDGGVWWSRVKKGVPVSLNVKCIAIDPHVTSTLYLGTVEGGIYKSIDAGENWVSMSSGMETKKPGKPSAAFRTINALAIDPQNPNTLYAATQAGIYKSINGAENWVEVSNGLTDIQDPQWQDYTGGVIAYAVAIDPTNSQIIYAATYGKGVFKSADGGTSWTGTLLALGKNKMFGGIQAFGENEMSVGVQALAINPKQPTIIYAGTTLSGVFKTSNAGKSWEPVNTGLGSQATKVGSLMIDPQNPNTVYAGTQRGVIRTTNGGQNWKFINSGLQPVPNMDQPVVLAIDPLNPHTMYAGTTLLGIYKSPNVEKE